jgi:hypothetical protein
MILKPIVELYRACGRPPLEDLYFTCEADYAQIKPLVQRIFQDDFARIEDLEIDDEDFDGDAKGLPATGDKISFRLRVPDISAITFHKNLADLLETDPKISHGEIPSEYYLLDDDFYISDPNRPIFIETLEHVCQLIKGLSKLAHYHDEKPSNGYLRLVFIQAAEGTIKPVELETRVNLAMVESARGLDPRIVVDLSESSAANDPHFSAKVGVFGMSLACFSSNKPSGEAFQYLVTNWDKFVAEYQRDLSTYLSGFAFHKAKKEVAEAELNIANEFSKVLCDISGKLLGIPVSVAAIIAISKADKFIEHLFLLIGIVIASYIIWRIVENQKRQFDRIEHAKELILCSIEGKIEIFPEELAKAVVELRAKLDSDARSLRSNLRLFGVLSWAPILVAISFLAYLYWGAIAAFCNILCDYCDAFLSFLLSKIVIIKSELLNIYSS